MSRGQKQGDARNTDNVTFRSRTEGTEHAITGNTQQAHLQEEVGGERGSSSVALNW